MGWLAAVDADHPQKYGDDLLGMRETPPRYLLSLFLVSRTKLEAVNRDQVVLSRCLTALLAHFKLRASMSATIDESLMTQEEADEATNSRT